MSAIKRLFQKIKKRVSTKEAKLEMARRCIGFVYIFEQRAFFTQELWRDVEGFKDCNRTDIITAFLEYWLYNKYGFCTAPAWFDLCTPVSKERFDEYMEIFKPVFDAYDKWIEEQR